MFSYYGGKGRIALHYPPPAFPLVIEPFAGGGWYSVRHAERYRDDGLPLFKSILVDPNPIVVETWRWLIQEATIDDMVSFPEHVAGTPMMRHTPDGKDYFYRWWGNQGAEKPRNYAGSFATWSLSKACSRLPLVKDWEIVRGTYDSLANVEATWFIDPPYQSDGKGSRYTFNEIDYDDLAKFCLSRRGQVIVCDREGADWLPFQPLAHATSQGQRNQQLKEVIWSNWD